MISSKSTPCPRATRPRCEKISRDLICASSFMSSAALILRCGVGQCSPQQSDGVGLSCRTLLEGVVDAVGVARDGAHGLPSRGSLGAPHTTSRPASTSSYGKMKKMAPFSSQWCGRSPALDAADEGDWMHPSVAAAGNRLALVPVSGRLRQNLACILASIAGAAIGHRSAVTSLQSGSSS